MLWSYLVHLVLENNRSGFRDENSKVTKINVIGFEMFIFCSFQYRYFKTFLSLLMMVYAIIQVIFSQMNILCEKRHVYFSWYGLLKEERERDVVPK